MQPAVRTGGERGRLEASCDRGNAADCAAAAALYLVAGDDPSFGYSAPSVLLESACGHGHAASCSRVARFHLSGERVGRFTYRPDREAAAQNFWRACELGEAASCQAACEAGRLTEAACARATATFTELARRDRAAALAGGVPAASSPARPDGPTTTVVELPVQQPAPPTGVQLAWRVLSAVHRDAVFIAGRSGAVRGDWVVVTLEATPPHAGYDVEGPTMAIAGAAPREPAGITGEPWPGRDPYFLPYRDRPGVLEEWATLRERQTGAYFGASYQGADRELRFILTTGTHLLLQRAGPVVISLLFDAAGGRGPYVVRLGGGSPSVIGAGGAEP